MMRSLVPRLAGLALLLADPMSVAAQQLENSTTAATSGTNGHGTEGRASSANLSAGSKGPASETTMAAPPPPQGGDMAGAATHAGGSDATKELFQH